MVKRPATLRCFKIVNPWSVDESYEYLNMDESRYLGQVEDAFLGFDPDIVAVSTGFDTYLQDWGGLLKIEDYRKIGRAIRNGAKRCGARIVPVRAPHLVRRHPARPAAAAQRAAQGQRDPGVLPGRLVAKAGRE